MSKYTEILTEICAENKIKLTTISRGWVHVLEKDGKIRYITGYKFDLNTLALGNILDDKYAFCELAKYKNLPIIEHNILFSNYDRREVLELFNKYNKCVVVKSNTGTCGREVFLCKELDPLYDCIDKLLKKHHSISLCPFIDIKEEYRVIVLNNEAKVVYGKIRPIVTGDGVKTIKELLMKFNPSYFKKEKNLPEQILEKGEKYVYSWQHNLSKGSIADLNIEETLKNKIIDLAIDVAKKCNIRFGSIDIIEDEVQNLYLIEANSGVMMDNFINIVENGKQLAKRIYEEAIISAFDE